MNPESLFLFLLWPFSGWGLREGSSERLFGKLASQQKMHQLKTSSNNKHIVELSQLVEPARPTNYNTVQHITKSMTMLSTKNEFCFISPDYNRATLFDADLKVPGALVRQ